MQIKIPKKIFFLFFLFPLLLTGCWDKEEIENRAYVVAIGMDVSKTNKDDISVSLLITNPEFGTQQQGGSSDVKPYELITLDSTDLISIKKLANSIVSKDISYDMVEQIIISEKLAKKKSFIRYMYDATKDAEIRRDLKLVVTKENPKVFFENTKPIIEPRLHKFYKVKIRNVEKTALIPTKSLLLNFYRITEADSDIFLGIYATTKKGEQRDNDKFDNFKAGELEMSNHENNTQFAGSAVFKKGQMIGTLDVEETRFVTLLNNTLPSNNLITTIPDPFDSKYKITIKVNHEQNNKLKMDFKKGNGTIDVDIPLTVEVLTNHSLTQYNTKKNRQKLETHIKHRIEKEMNKLIERTQKEFKAQPFGWSLYVRKQFLTLQEYQKFNWHKKYPDMAVKLNISVNITDYGRQKEVPTTEDLNR